MNSSFKSIPLIERPREKAITRGIDSLSDQELLAIILKCGTKGQNVLELSTQIMKKYFNFNNLMSTTYEDLITITGIKKAKAIEILTIMEIAKRIQNNKLENIKSINSPDDIYDNFSIYLKNEDREKFMVIFLNIKSHIIKYEILFVGGTSISIIDVNLILRKAINYGASKIICMHNHPSGDPSASTQDILVTKKINNAANLLDIKLLDHIIVGKMGYISLKKEGIF